MLTFQGRKGVEFCDGLTRRDFLRVGSLSAGGLSLSLGDMALANARSADMNCIVLFLVGGPSHVDTWDPKPNAPDNVRGPFRPIRTNVPGIQIGEHFPLMAGLADKYALIRSVHHEAAPIHETGHQMMQTGRLFRAGEEYPHYGAVLSYLKGSKVPGLPASVVLPSPIRNTGVSVSHGQGAGFLGQDHEPFSAPSTQHSALSIQPEETVAGIDPARLDASTALVDAVDQAHRRFDHNAGRIDNPNANTLSSVFGSRAKRAFNIDAESGGIRSRYGRNTFGQSCLLARRLVEHGVRFVTVNMFDTVFNEITWDCHADGGSLAVTLDDYKRTLCPMFDAAYSALLSDLDERGMLQNTLVVAMGEFGRTPHLNSRGGRDHWPGAWSILFAGGSVKGGQVIGATDKTGSEPRDRPVSPAEVAASVYHSLGIDAHTHIPARDGAPTALIDAPHVSELFT